MNVRNVWQVVIVLTAVFLVASAVAEVPQMINYQGRLTDDQGDPVPNGTYSMVFTIYDAETNGYPKWTEPHPAVEIVNGLFNVILGAGTPAEPIEDTVFSGADRWLGIQVGRGDEIEPRTRLISAPYAYRVSTVDGASGGTIWGDVQILSDERSPGDLFVASKATIGPGHTNTGHCAFAVGDGHTVSGDRASVGGGLRNIVSGALATIGGGTDDTAYGAVSTIGGGTGNYIGIDRHHATIGGGCRNRIIVGAFGTISGGNDNTIGAGGGAIGGGQFNSIGEIYATVGGGAGNAATNQYCVVAGGHGNAAISQYCTVGGGHCDTASGHRSTVTGGEYNVASGDASTVCGGARNLAAGTASVAMGYRDTLTENADYSMAFGDEVYIDTDHRVAFYNGVQSGKLGINRDDESSGIDHPIHVGTGTSNGNGAYLSAGGVWTNASSRVNKEGFQPLEREALLDKVASMPVESWQYKGSNERHIGPVAEDFVAAFDVGTITVDGTRDNRHLSQGDVAGVSLAAVQALLDKVEKLEQRIAELEAR
ncbi:MAG: hypothetical protein KAU35_03715 [candidate division Zixibacteria bacterium]|nr:hypothetical protein [candidate division Zixibacteria bacterium]